MTKQTLVTWEVVGGTFGAGAVTWLFLWLFATWAAENALKMPTACEQYPTYSECNAAITD